MMYLYKMWKKSFKECEHFKGLYQLLWRTTKILVTAGTRNEPYAKTVVYVLDVRIACWVISFKASDRLWTAWRVYKIITHSTVFCLFSLRNTAPVKSIHPFDVLSFLIAFTNQSWSIFVFPEKKPFFSGKKGLISICKRITAHENIFPPARQQVGCTGAALSRPRLECEKEEGFSQRIPMQPYRALKSFTWKNIF